MPSNCCGVEFMPRFSAVTSASSWACEHICSKHTTRILICKPFPHVPPHQWPRLRFEICYVRLCVKQNGVVYRPILTSKFVMSTASTPYDFAAEVSWAKNCVHKQFQIVAGSRVAMEVYRTSQLQ